MIYWKRVRGGWAIFARKPKRADLSVWPWMRRPDEFDVVAALCLISAVAMFVGTVMVLFVI